MVAALIAAVVVTFATARLIGMVRAAVIVAGMVVGRRGGRVLVLRRTAVCVGYRGESLKGDYQQERQQHVFSKSPDHQHSVNATRTAINKAPPRLRTA